jgi:hypothetical protein
VSDLFETRPVRRANVYTKLSYQVVNRVRSDGHAFCPVDVVGSIGAQTRVSVIGSLSYAHPDSRRIARWPFR